MRPQATASLREATAADFTLVKGWLDRPETHRFLDPMFHGSRFTQLQYQLLLARQESSRLWLARADGVDLGLVGLSAIDTHGASAEVWYALGDEARAGRGLMTAAVATALTRAFGELGLSTVRAWVARDNHASVRLLERLGFHAAGTWRASFRDGDRRVDRLWFDLTRDEWQARSGDAVARASGSSAREPSVSRLVRETRVPLIAELAPIIARARRERTDLVDLGQAVPNFVPPRGAVERAASALADVDAHRYTVDEGRPSLREKWARVLSRRFGVEADPSCEMLITAGANQAYALAAMTLVGPGERMGILSPWYFNHAMAIEMIGAEVCELPLAAESGYQIDADRLVAEAKRLRLKALTLVNPNNPTGVTYAPAAVRHLAEGLIEAGIVLVVDETYAFFADERVGHFSPGSLEPRPRNVVTLGSFSKTFGMTGWRVGYLVASEPIIREALKVHDTVVICASHPGQLLVEACLDTAWDWVAERRRETAARADLVRQAAHTLAPWEVVSVGPFFAFLRGPRPGRETALELLERDGVIVLPGEGFGTNLTNALRVSLGCAGASQLEEGLRRMSRRFAQTPNRERP